MKDNKYPHPITGKLVSRQRIYQFKQQQLGKCVTCGNHSFGKAKCNKCASVEGVKKRHLLHQQWMKVDWTKPVTEIAKELNVCRETVRKYKRIYKQ